MFFHYIEQFIEWIVRRTQTTDQTQIPSQIQTQKKESSRRDNSSHDLQYKDYFLIPSFAMIALYLSMSICAR